MTPTRESDINYQPSLVAAAERAVVEAIGPWVQNRRYPPVDAGAERLWRAGKELLRLRAPAGAAGPDHTP